MADQTKMGHIQTKQYSSFNNHIDRKGSKTTKTENMIFMRFSTR